jgi:hypothetical protein
MNHIFLHEMNTTIKELKELKELKERLEVEYSYQMG